KGDAKASHHLEVIDRELSRSDDVIERLLELTKGESLKREPVDLRELATEAMAYSNVAGDYRLSVRFIPEFFAVNLDRILFRQVLCNLFLNAIQAMPEGGTIKLLVERHEDGIISMKISDSGIGIQKKNLQKIFEPLFTIREEGVGLGLSLCRDLITRHGGSIKAESETEVGTTILITLPEVALSFEIMDDT
ncbi:MAG: ATP-binding protein, partial [Verrucomicrobiota bacterium]|nr:ATP-binding protein [Verrucomicrobiota bacterium]